MCNHHLAPRHLAWLTLAATLFLAPSLSQACGPYGISDKVLFSDDPKVVRKGTSRLRAFGPYGLDLLITQHADAIERIRKGQELTPRDKQLMSAIDAVAGQRDAAYAGLYWYDDLEKAKQAAAASQKPILSLHLLGKLTDERSCANSRFFRAALYPDPAVNKILRDKYILVWQTVREVPKLTVDMGDGRRIERTITGNSIHYVLDEQGNVLDGIPGLFSPEAFAKSLENARAIYDGLANADPTVRNVTRVNLLRTYMNATDTDWAATLARLGSPQSITLKPASSFKQANNQANLNEMSEQEFRATAQQVGMQAQQRTFSKRIVEMPILKAGLIAAGPKSEQQALTDAQWRMVADATHYSPRLCATSRNLIRRHMSQQPGGNAQHTEAAIEAFQRDMAGDTAIGRFQLQPQLRQWLAQAKPMTLTALNEKVYAELFKTPLDDPWMGLNTPGLYDGLNASGMHLPLPTQAADGKPGATPAS